MKLLSFDWPQSASALVSLAKQEGELIKLIMAGTTHLESWLIENRILPALQEKALPTLHFATAGDENHTAALLPLPDGSAFGFSAAGWWFPLESHEAMPEIQYIGARFASGDHWLPGFSATVELPDDRSRIPATPLEVAKVWREATGSRPHGFELGIYDQIEALGMDVVDRVFNTQGRLGL